ncbi:hypothetical protein BDW02DRAFT_571700 [Decorospora gaudefroyi]|uniref:Uncharacterized protein n=1 Tax=Decorospora gaudefroyi TaxID=184978 RepID=A0A6A5K614_9PLEO|nr:hypothetical protein BDW02DRAFT_571700 [Decorospora gaudefroyi]
MPEATSSSSPTSTSPQKPTFHTAIYGTISSTSQSPTSDNAPDDTENADSRRRYYIFPPNINGHGRLIVAHRTVPYVVGCLFVVC